MARLVVEDAILYVIIFYGVMSILSQVNFFNSYFPGMQYNSSINSFVPYACISHNNTPFNTFSAQDRFAKYTSEYTILDPNKTDPTGLLNPLRIVAMMGSYISMFVDIVSGTFLSDILYVVFGSSSLAMTYARLITFVINIAAFIVFFTMITGRLRRD
jgi:hypothetical protein